MMLPCILNLCLTPHSGKIVYGSFKLLGSILQIGKRFKNPSAYKLFLIATFSAKMTSVFSSTFSLIIPTCSTQQYYPPRLYQCQYVSTDIYHKDGKITDRMTDGIWTESSCKIRPVWPSTSSHKYGRRALRHQSSWVPTAK